MNSASGETILQEGRRNKDILRQMKAKEFVASRHTFKTGQRTFSKWK